MKQRLSVRLLGEFVVVVLGILGAFAIDDWNAKRGDRALERAYLEGLASDLRADDHELDVNRGAALRRAVQTGRILTAAGFPPPPLGAPVFSVPLDLSDTLTMVGCEGFASCIGDHRVFDGSPATYDGLVASGNLRVLRNRELVRALAAYYATAASERDADVAMGRPNVRELQRALNRRGFTFSDGTPGASPREAELVPAVRADPELRALLLQVRVNAMWQVGRIETVHRPVLHAVLEDVEAESARAN